jgi:hypothetical protein
MPRNRQCAFTLSLTTVGRSMSALDSSMGKAPLRRSTSSAFIEQGWNDATNNPPFTVAPGTIVNDEDFLDCAWIQNDLILAEKTLGCSA